MASTPPQKDDAGHSCVPNFIEGKAISLPSSASFPVVCANTGQIIYYAQSADSTTAEAACESAAAAFATYKTTLVSERRKMLLRAADLFEAKAEEAVIRQMGETSCTKSWAELNIKAASEILHEIAGAISGALTGEMPPSGYDGYTSLVLKQPLGTALIISPWNAAVVLAVRGIGSALAAGCTVVLKASELSPWSHQLVVETFHAAGFPKGAINMVIADRPCGPQITEKMIAHQAIRKIEFIGSADVGLIIGSLCGKYLKPVLMELGDQSPAIILDDADLQQAATLCVLGAMLNHGQVCWSTQRIIVQKSVRKEFQRLLITGAQNFPATGTAVSIQAAEKAKAQIDDAVKDGARFLTGNSEVQSASLKPSILVDVDPNSTISNREAFAPTVILTGVDSDAEAIENANSRFGGLSTSVFTSSYERGLIMARELECGQVQINNLTMFNEYVGPTTCVKGSGWGRTAGRYGIEEFLFTKTISLTPTRKVVGTGRS